MAHGTLSSAHPLDRQPAAGRRLFACLFRGHASCVLTGRTLLLYILCVRTLNEIENVNVGLGGPGRTHPTPHPRPAGRAQKLTPTRVWDCDSTPDPAARGQLAGPRRTGISVSSPGAGARSVHSRTVAGCGGL